MDKLVSVYIPTYNRMELLHRAIKSVINQTYKNIEIVVCSDNSSDDTDRLMCELVKKHNNIKYVKNNINLGACATRNKAIKNCSGYYITGLDDDDYFLPERVSNFIQKASVNDGVIYYSNVYIKHENKEVKNKKIRVVREKDIIKRNSIGNQVFCKKDIMLSAGSYDSNLKMWQDKECWVRLLEKTKLAMNTECYDYVMDVSHDHERISNIKHEKLQETILYLIKNKKCYNGFVDYLFVSASGYKDYRISYGHLIALLFKVDLQAKISIMKRFYYEVINKRF